jgi:hypothetical protein
MKIEMGESLVYSYMRHKKNCLVTQTNWKSSGSWNTDLDVEDRVIYEFDKIRSHHAFADIFGTQSLEQVIKQAEIDVLGISSDNKIYAFEIAFHENGLNYGSKIETRNRIIKKLLRGYLTLKRYFPRYHYTLVFCSPKVNNATEQHIKEYFEVLKNDFSDEYVSFEYYSNGNFHNEILEKTLQKITNESDSSELFSRAIKLLKLSKSFTQQIQPTIPRNNIQTEEEIHQPNQEIVIIRGVDMPVPKPQTRGVFQDGVKAVMSKLLNQNILTDIEIIYLQDAQYCKKELNLNYPLLRLESQGADINGYTRYWTREIFNGYLVCSEWYPLHATHNHYEYFKNWLYSFADRDKLVA